MERHKYKHYTQEERLDWLKQYDESGKSVRGFCRDTNLNAYPLHVWVRSRKSQTRMFREDPADGRFVPLRLPEMQGSPSPIQTPLNVCTESDLITIRKGEWFITVPRDAQTYQLEQIIQAIGGIHEV